jgi:hypothetical protein
LISNLQTDAKPIKDAMNQFNTFLNDLETKYINNKIIFLTDNPAFDIANLDYNLGQLFVYES